MGLAEPSAVEGGARLLLVEDDDDLRDVFVCLLASDTLAVDDFDNAEAALAHFLHRPCAVVVTDHGLPGMSGLELAEHVHAAAPATWVIVASGVAEKPVERDESRRLQFLTKPFPIETLQGLINQCLVSA